MPNDNYYVVIVPHADQAAQAVSTSRVVGHASRHEPAAQRHAPKSAPPSRPHAAAPNATAGGPARGRAAALGGAAPKRAARGGGGRIRTWSVVVGDQKYDVTDFGALCGYKIELGGTLVWTGALSGRGYETRTTTLPEDTLKEVLRLARVGDQRETAKAGVSPDAPQAPPSAAPKSETRAKPARAAKVEPKRKAPAKPKPKPTAPKSAGGAAAPAPASAPKAEHKSAPPPKRRSRKAASSRSGPPTQRTPAQPTAASTPAQPTHAAPPAAKPRGRRAATKMDDKAVLDGLMKKLRKEDPSTADQSFTALKRIWLGGGREATAAWMNVHKFPSAVDAFSDWMEKHFEAAQTMLEKAPHSAPKSAKVA